MEPEIQAQYCKVAVVGNVDSGKSTLVGVLTKGRADNGNGSARQLVFNFSHEKESGKTSSICYEIMGFNNDGRQVVPERLDLNRNRYWDEVTSKSTKLVNFLDLCGHLKYIRTTITGICGLAPDFAMVVIGSNMGIAQITTAHLTLCLFMKIPVFIILTKIDLSPTNVLDQTSKQIKDILKRPSANRIPVFIKEGTPKQLIAAQADMLSSNKNCPIFLVSNVKLSGVEQLVFFLSRLKNRNSINRHLGKPEDPFQFNIVQTFLVKGIGLVVSGLVKSGSITLDQQCYIGPDRNKAYKVVTIKSIHAQRRVMTKAKAGDLVCFNIKINKANDKLARTDIRKGTMLLDIQTKPEPIYEFEAQVQVLQNPTTMKEGYESVLHLGLVEQVVRIKKLINSEQEVMRSQDRGLVRFKFVFMPEHIRERDIFVLRQGMVKAIGIVTRVFREQDVQPNGL